MNAKMKKVVSEMKKVEDKIKEYQAKWRELDKQKTELENLEIIGMIRGAKIDINNLPDAIQAYRDKDGVPFSSEETNLKEETKNDEI